MDVLFARGHDHDICQVNVKLFILNVDEICHRSIATGQRIIWVCNSGTLQALLKLEMCLPMITMYGFNFPVFLLVTRLKVQCNWLLTTIYSTDVISGCMCGTEAVLVICKWGLAVVDGAAWVTNCNAINDNNPYLTSIRIDTKTPMAEVVQFWLTI